MMLSKEHKTVGFRLAVNSKSSVKSLTGHRITFSPASIANTFSSPGPNRLKTLFIYYNIDIFGRIAGQELWSIMPTLCSNLMQAIRVLVWMYDGQ